MWQSGMMRFVVGSFLLALVELIGFAAHTATHRAGAGVVAVRPARRGSYGSSRLTCAPASRSRSPILSRHLTSTLRANGARADLVDPAEKHYNPIGMVHGGAAAALLDPETLLVLS